MDLAVDLNHNNDPWIVRSEYLPDISANCNGAKCVATGVVLDEGAEGTAGNETGRGVVKSRIDRWERLSQSETTVIDANVFHDYQSRACEKFIPSPIVIPPKFLYGSESLRIQTAVEEEFAMIRYNVIKMKADFQLTELRLHYATWQYYVSKVAQKNASRPTSVTMSADNSHDSVESKSRVEDVEPTEPEKQNAIALNQDTFHQVAPKTQKLPFFTTDLQLMEMKLRYVNCQYEMNRTITHLMKGSSCKPETISSQQEHDVSATQVADENGMVATADLSVMPALQPDGPESRSTLQPDIVSRTNVQLLNLKLEHAKLSNESNKLRVIPRVNETPVQTVESPAPLEETDNSASLNSKDSETTSEEKPFRSKIPVPKIKLMRANSSNDEKSENAWFISREHKEPSVARIPPMPRQTVPPQGPPSKPLKSKIPVLSPPRKLSSRRKILIQAEIHEDETANQSNASDSRQTESDEPSTSGEATPKRTMSRSKVRASKKRTDSVKSAPTFKSRECAISPLPELYRHKRALTPTGTLHRSSSSLTHQSEVRSATLPARIRPKRKHLPQKDSPWRIDGRVSDRNKHKYCYTPRSSTPSVDGAQSLRSLWSETSGPSTFVSDSTAVSGSSLVSDSTPVSESTTMMSEVNEQDDRIGNAERRRGKHERQEDDDSQTSLREEDLLPSNDETALELPKLTTFSRKKRFSLRKKTSVKISDENGDPVMPDAKPKKKKRKWWKWLGFGRK